MRLGLEIDVERIVNYSDIVENLKNPFTEDLHIDTKKVLRRYKRDEVINNEEEDLSREEALKLTKEQTELRKKGIEYAQLQTKQKCEFVFIYIPTFPYDKLPEVSFKIFFYIIDNKVSRGRDMVVIGIDECCQKFGLTRPTIVRGFIELVRNKIISKQSENVWWINPNYFYSGNRLMINCK